MTTQIRFLILYPVMVDPPITDLSPHPEWLNPIDPPFADAVESRWPQVCQWGAAPRSIVQQPPKWLKKKPWKNGCLWPNGPEVHFLGEGKMESRFHSDVPGLVGCVKPFRKSCVNVLKKNASNPKNVFSKVIYKHKWAVFTMQIAKGPGPTEPHVLHFVQG